MQKSNIIILQDSVILTKNVCGISKFKNPATLQTPEFPYLQINLIDSSPIILVYENDTVCDKDYTFVVKLLNEYHLD
jgi:hypothetical protein